MAWTTKSYQNFENETWAKMIKIIENEQNCQNHHKWPEFSNLQKMTDILKMTKNDKNFEWPKTFWKRPNDR